MARKPAVTHGFVVVDKPAGMTSHDVVGRLRRRFNERRVGHSGTLDPDATGVLLVAIGNATRLLQFFGNLPKTYTGEVVFGTATTTLDASGEVVATSDMSTLTIERVREASRRFVGDIMQVPPMVSALKVDGRRLHEIAREGGEVEREPRQVTVHRYVVLDEVERVGRARRSRRRDSNRVESAQRTARGLSTQRPVVEARSRTARSVSVTTRENRR
ncbi:MAG: tRNA pseudouridine(55) synthase TruB [Actinobacteria bacterium]|nr:tRNA pseudouridine(55) synthase TruB [Actinomycetota bacterium]